MSCRYPYLTPCLRSLYVCYCSCNDKPQISYVKSSAGMLAIPREASRSRTLATAGQFFWRVKAPAVNCCEKFKSIFMFAKKCESVYPYLNVCSSGGNGFAKDSCKSSRLHCINVRLWHPCARVNWHLCFSIKHQSELVNGDNTAS